MTEANSYLRELNRIGNSYSPVIGRIIKRDYERVAKQVAEGNTVFTLDPKPYAKAITRLIVQAGSDRALREYNRLIKLKRSNDEIIYEWVSFLARYAQLNMANHVTRITQTTEDKLKEIIEKGLLDGNGYDVIARNIRQESDGQFNRYRSLLIARTEGANASNKGAFLAAKASGLVMQKSWLHAGHAKRENRPHHVALDREKPIDLDQPFWVNGKFMMHPGDPAGGAEENCNCRCCAVYKPKRGADGLVQSVMPRKPTIIQRLAQAAIIEEVLRLIFINVFGDE